MSVPAATPRERYFCSLGVISHLRKVPLKYHVPRRPRKLASFATVFAMLAFARYRDGNTSSTSAAAAASANPISIQLPFGINRRADSRNARNAALSNMIANTVVIERQCYQENNFRSGRCG